jgi:hypothetical protein
MSDIPSSLAPFFQEYDFSKLDLDLSAGTIIERTLQYGNREEIRWLFQTYPKQRIRDWVERWGNIALSEPHRSFWALALDIPVIQ